MYNGGAPVISYMVEEKENARLGLATYVALH